MGKYNYKGNRRGGSGKSFRRDSKQSRNRQVRQTHRETVLSRPLKTCPYPTIPYKHRLTHSLSARVGTCIHASVLLIAILKPLDLFCPRLVLHSPVAVKCSPRMSEFFARRENSGLKFEGILSAKTLLSFLGNPICLFEYTMIQLRIFLHIHRRLFHLNKYIRLQSRLSRLRQMANTNGRTASLLNEAVSQRGKGFQKRAECQKANPQIS